MFPPVVTLGFTIGDRPKHNVLNSNVGTRHAFRGSVETRTRHDRQQLLVFGSRDDPFDVFRGLLFALPTSVLGFWVPLMIVLASRLRLG